MKLELMHRSTSIADVMAVVDRLRENGVNKDAIYVITNQATKETIHRNYDLRRQDGSVFSSHRLLANINCILHLQEYESYFNKQPLFDTENNPLTDYQQAIGYGSMVVLVATTH
ncbi:general stress protein [Jeotgalibaca arthritidis]|uniref:General stress protein 17M-like domain-containing protein n=1 Tax=Jeotgalibaca arthritidis TaxID=1868794 RepID=A0A6G7K9F3_9LACT|nr:general stress protein [Jeotgalibaca arthritidis]QII81841.1 hypothetical protein G7057_04685 [Jeotgalibaca arthritidis]